MAQSVKLLMTIFMGQDDHIKFNIPCLIISLINVHCGAI